MAAKKTDAKKNAKTTNKGEQERVVAKNLNGLKKIVDATIAKYGNECDLNFIDVSKVTDMHRLFLRSDFNGDISKWDVSNVTNMSFMFYESQFNGDISKWNVSKVTNMSFMFEGSRFNGDISKWDVSNVTNMCRMFVVTKFRGDISKWNVSNVMNMDGMFYESGYNGDISKWNVSNVTKMKSMFMHSRFNGDISKWDVSNVTDMSGMFLGSQFNGDISKWNVSSVTDAHQMFYMSKFNGDINGWNISAKCKAKDMFGETIWDVKGRKLPDWYKSGKIVGKLVNDKAVKSKTTSTMKKISKSEDAPKNLKSLKSMNNPVVKCRVKQKRVVAKNVVDLKKIIKEAIAKYGNNCDLNFIDVSKVTNMRDLFRQSEFNGDISEWNVSKVTNMEGLFFYSSFTGDISKWNVSNVTNMSHMFHCSKFNGEISHWDVSKVTNMAAMFDASEFNGDISRWEVSNVRNMFGLFRDSEFDGNISEWNVSNVKNMGYMFENSQFNGDISKWNVSTKCEANGMFFRSVLEEDEKIPNWYKSDKIVEKPANDLPKKTKSSEKGSSKTTKINVDITNVIVMSATQIKKFTTVYGKKSPFFLGTQAADLNKILSGKESFGSENKPPFDAYKKMAEKGLEFEFRWESTDFMTLESMGIGNGCAKGGKLWYCVDFDGTRGVALEEYGRDWDARSSEFVKHVDKYGNNCEIKNHKVEVLGDSQQNIFALPAKKMLKAGSNKAKRLSIFKIPYYLDAAFDSDGLDSNDFRMGDELRCSTKDGRGEVFLLDKKGKKIKSISDFDHSEPDKDGDVYYPVPASDLGKGTGVMSLTTDAIAKWKKKLGVKK